MFEENLLACSPGNISGHAYALYDQGVSYYHLGLQAQNDGNVDLAGQYWHQAQEKLLDALEKNTRMRGALAIDTIDNQEALGDLYLAQKRYSEASNAYMAVLTMAENLLGKEDKRVEQVKKKMDFSLA